MKNQVNQNEIDKKRKKPPNKNAQAALTLVQKRTSGRYA
jgi:hypothetical protein